jgi:hypothetical protein
LVTFTPRRKWTENHVSVSSPRFCVDGECSPPNQDWDVSP